MIVLWSLVISATADVKVIAITHCHQYKSKWQLYAYLETLLKNPGLKWEGHEMRMTLHKFQQYLT